MAKSIPKLGSRKNVCIGSHNRKIREGKHRGDLTRMRTKANAQGNDTTFNRKP